MALRMPDSSKIPRGVAVSLAYCQRLLLACRLASDRTHDLVFIVFQRTSAGDRVTDLGTTSVDAVVAMPPRRHRGERVQLNARVPVEVEQRLQRFVRDYDTTVQDCVHLALVEFLNARGYPPVVGA
jgi:hypothetical protein